MKIDDFGKAPSLSTTNINQRQAATEAAKAVTVETPKADSANVSSSASVTISSQAQNLGQTGKTEVFDTKKVEEIKAAIAKGEFEIDADKIADGLLKTVRELIQQPKE